VLAGEDPKRLGEMTKTLTPHLGEPGNWPRDPDVFLPWLDRFLERNLLDPPAARKSIAVVFDYAAYLVPAGDLASQTRGQAAALVRFLHWAQNRMALPTLWSGIFDPPAHTSDADTPPC
jgi:hypothetical protein